MQKCVGGHGGCIAHAKAPEEMRVGQKGGGVGLGASRKSRVHAHPDVAFGLATHVGSALPCGTIHSKV
eukprot:364707-Chlamydomonas_euryale.AAC.15